MGGVVSEGLAAVVREQKAMAVVATPALELDARRVELFEEMRHSGICTNAAAAYVGRSKDWLYGSSSKRGPRAVQGPRSNLQEKLLPAREALAKPCCAKGCAHRWVLGCRLRAYRLQAVGLQAVGCRLEAGGLQAAGRRLTGCRLDAYRLHPTAHC